MEIHNITEEIVFNSLKTLFDSFQNKGNPEQYCFCEQCRIDIACYVLNRCTPQYIVSNRGAARIKLDDIELQQLEADIATLINEGLKRIKENKRPTAHHNISTGVHPHIIDEEIAVHGLCYNIPVIVGRIFDGSTFTPMAGVKVELFSDGRLVTMKNRNWQNPYTLVANTAGSYTFWPIPVKADKANDHKIFEYSLTVEAPEYETLIHHFKVPAISLEQSTVPFSIERTFKLPDMYMFPPGEAEQDD